MDAGKEKGPAVSDSPVLFFLHITEPSQTILGDFPGGPVVKTPRPGAGAPDGGAKIRRAAAKNK